MQKQLPFHCSPGQLIQGAASGTRTAALCTTLRVTTAQGYPAPVLPLPRPAAPSKPWPDIPVIDPNQLPELDGFLLGIPTR